MEKSKKLVKTVPLTTPQSAKDNSRHERTASMTIELSPKKKVKSVKHKRAIKSDKLRRLDVLRRRLSFSPHRMASSVHLKSPKLSPILRSTSNINQQFQSTASVPILKGEESYCDNSLLNENMTIETVLKSIGLVHYSEKLCTAGIDLEQFLAIDDQALKSIGVKDRYDRRNIIHAINDFK